MNAFDRESSDWVSTMLPPAAAAFATITSATALTGVLRGWLWLSYVVVAVVLVSCTGLALRSLRLPPIAVGLSQLTVLFLLITGMFTNEGILAVIPGPAAIGELGDVLATAGQQIKTGLPPVEATAPILCLASIGIGMVAVLVDTLAVAAAAPAASGLVLLCLYAVPASLADEMLPWWTFALGAAAFAALMAVDGNHRHRAWRGKGTAVGRSPEAAAAPSGVVVIALTLGLLIGSAFTAIGTVGQLPGAGPGEARSFSGGLGISPFTSMRGLLNDRGTSEVFRVRGMGKERRLLRAFTLDTFRNNQGGWQLESRKMRPGVPASSDLPLASGDRGGKSSRIQIEPVSWNDYWLPVYGLPRDIDGIDNSWYYDEISGTIYSERKQRPPAYTLTTSMTEPTAKQLRAASPEDGVQPNYLRLQSIDDRVVNLTRNITKGEQTAFDKAESIYRYLTEDGGYVYDTQTAPKSDENALVDFLLKGKRGYCEQFASSMAVMLRLEGIPSRVAIGFTAGSQTGDYLSITTRDAHAWVEVYFGAEYGWVAFDPTPLADGRGSTLPYLNNGDNGDNGPNPADDPNNRAEGPGTQEPSGVEPAAPKAETEEPVTFDQAPAFARWSTLLFLLLAGLVTAAMVVVARRTAELRAEVEPEADTKSAAIPAFVRRWLPQDREKLSLARRWLPIATAGSWLLCVWLIGWMLSWWFGLLLVLVAAAAITPAVLREDLRGKRLHSVLMRDEHASESAWQELLDECADRQVPVGVSDTLRVTARRMAADHQLDDQRKNDLRTVVAALERSWYGGDRDTGPEFAPAFERLRQGLNRQSPLSLMARLLPASVITRLRALADRLTKPRPGQGPAPSES